ncbi:hypothetical protein CA2015_2814 [Cyclobacterium amurskyense]|uniref:Uncharacterized protein n=1 Tax=Cyclobacterium amurskyense TaxID=320787 RepID=A0A0H4PD97_9BACT|nr:hypothetical protein CA2015_2814 [Cyclobacterium amurskyense]
MAIINTSFFKFRHLFFCVQVILEKGRTVNVKFSRILVALLLGWLKNEANPCEGNQLSLQ